MCIPGYPSIGPSFLDAPLLATQKGGYEFRFVPGSPAPDAALQSGRISNSSLSGWALVAVPLQRGQTGIRAFCADMHGNLCFTPDGNVPNTADGECPVSNERGRGGCTPLL